MKPNNLPPEQKKKLAVIALLLLAIPGLALNAWPGVKAWSSWGVDFNQFYCGGHLVGTGHLYDWDALRKCEAAHGPEVPTARLPVVLYGHKILGRLPYQAARSIWLVISLLALAGFVTFWPGANPLLMVTALAWSMPATMAILYGQDLPLWLMFFTVGLVLLEKDRPYSAGVAFSLCLCKFHLVLGLPVMLMAQRRWKAVSSGAACCGMWLALCFVIEGPGWISAYRNRLQMPQMSPEAAKMPNLHGITTWLPVGIGGEILLATALLLLLWTASRGNRDLGMAGAAVTACGLLVGRHGYPVDCVLLIPLAVLNLQRPAIPVWMKGWSLLILSPMPIMLLTSSQPALGQVMVVAFVVTAVWINRGDSPLREPAGRDSRVLEYGNSCGVVQA